MDCIRLLDRRAEPGSRCATAAAQVFYEEVVDALADLPFLPPAGDGLLAIRNTRLMSEKTRSAFDEDEEVLHAGGFVRGELGTLTAGAR